MLAGVGWEVVRGDFVKFLQFFGIFVGLQFVCFFSQSGNLPPSFSLLRVLYYEILRDLCSAWCTVLCDILAVQFLQLIFVLTLTLHLFIFHFYYCFLHVVCD